MFTFRTLTDCMQRAKSRMLRIALCEGCTVHADSEDVFVLVGC